MIANNCKFNTVRVNAFPKLDYISNNLNLDAIVQAFTSRGIVTQIEVHDFTGTYPEGAELDRLINYWVDKANRFKDNPYVWFNIMNEPGGNEPVKELWKTTHEAVIKAIRATGAENIIVLDGAQFGQENGYRDPSYSGILTYREYFVQNYSNITFAFHVYSTWAGRQSSMEQYIDAMWAKNLSVHVGEYGSNLSETSAMFNTIIPKGVGRIVWHWAGGDDHDLTTGTSEGGGWQIDNTDGSKPGNLSWMGNIIWDDNHGIPVKTPVALPTNDLVTNGSFENDFAGWMNWGGASVVTDVAQVGNKALKVSAGAAGGGGQVLGLAPNTTYRLSAWGKNSADIGVKYKLPDGTEPHYILTFSSSEWTQKDVVFTTPASITDGLVFIWKNDPSVDFYADAISVTSANLLKNGGFEEDLTGWMNWGRLEVQTTDVHSGAKALRVNGGGNGGGGVAIDLKPNTNYVLSAWGKNIGTPTAGSDIGFQYRATDGGNQIQHIMSFTETAWTQKEVKFRTAATFAGGSGSVFVWKQGVDNSFLVDDIVLMENPNQNNDETAPTTPANLAATATTNSVTLTWEAATDSVGVTGYKVFRGEALLTTVTDLTHMVTGLAAEAAYTFSVSAIDAAGNESAKATVSTRTSYLAVGKIFREYYSGIKGKSITDLTSNPKFPNSPSSVIALSQFEAPSNYANNYGSRIRGFVCVPESGNYTFWIAADDVAELWLSTDADPANKVKVASVNRATGVREWTKQASQKSAPIRLQAGYKYYIEALHLESSKGDHLSVGWTLPSGTHERPIAGSRLSPWVEAARSVAREVKEVEAAEEVVLYPNPAREVINVDFTASVGKKVTIWVVDGLSKVRLSASQVAKEGKNKVSLDTQSLNRGMYFVIISLGDKTITKKVVVTN